MEEAREEGGKRQEESLPLCMYMCVSVCACACVFVSVYVGVWVCGCIWEGLFVCGCVQGCHMRVIILVHMWHYVQFA